MCDFLNTVPVTQIYLQADNCSVSASASYDQGAHHDGAQLTTDEQLSFTENVPSSLRCVALSGYPPGEMNVFIGRRDVTADLRLSQSSKLSGRKGLRLIEYTTTRWSDEFEARTGDDGKSVKCVISVANVVTNFTEASVIVNCERYYQILPIDCSLLQRLYLGNKAEVKCYIQLLKLTKPYSFNYHPLLVF